MTERGLQVIIAALSALGAAVAGYLVYVHYAGLSPMCVAGGGCEVVQSSKYATPLGVPVALLGLAGYLLIGASALTRHDAARLGGLCLAVAGFGFSLYLTYLELFVIHAICQWCVASAIIMTMLLAVCARRFAAALNDPPAP